MSLVERMAYAKILANKPTKPSKWKIFKDLRDRPENFELRAFFEADGITIRIEPRGIEQ